MKLGEKQTVEMLTKCYPGFAEPILTPQEATIRGQMVFDDMEQVRFPLEWECDWPVDVPGYEPVRIPSYRLPGVSYGPLADPDGTKGRDAAGPAISCGEFVRLSRACLLGRSLLGAKRWPSLFASRLRHPDDHLAVVEEVLWLGRWRSPKHIRNSHRQNPESEKNVDWRFQCCEMIINLEIKSRRRDWMGVTDGESYSRDFDSYFDDVLGKFGPRTEGERNVVGVTTFFPPEETLRRATARFLEAHPEIDAIVFWSLHDPEGKRPEVFGSDADLIRLLLNESSREENLFISPIRHLWRKRDERRALRVDEALAILTRAVRPQPPASPEANPP